MNNKTLVHIDDESKRIYSFETDSVPQIGQYVRIKLGIMDDTYKIIDVTHNIVGDENYLATSVILHVTKMQ